MAVVEVVTRTKGGWCTAVALRFYSDRETGALWADDWADGDYDGYIVGLSVTWIDDPRRPLRDVAEKLGMRA